LARGLHIPFGTSGGFRTARRESVQCLCFVSVAIGRHGQVLPFLPFPTFPEEKVHFMRFKNSYAAAVAAAVSAVVFSAAFQPVQASIIVIDDFTQAQVATASGAGSAVSADVQQAGSFGGFNTRGTIADYLQSSTRGTRTVLSTSNGTGTGTLQLTNNGSGAGQTTAVGAQSLINYYFDPEGSSVDMTGQQYPGFWIETAATSSTPGNAFTGYIYVTTGTGGGDSVQLDLPGMWAPNTGTGILFSTLSALNPALDFTKVRYFEVGIKNVAPLPGSTAYNASANFTAISVPEPTHLVFVAGIGATLGAWRLRKLRRTRTAAGEAIAS
jgi:hypothetical protein